MKLMTRKAVMALLMLAFTVSAVFMTSESALALDQNLAAGATVTGTIVGEGTDTITYTVGDESYVYFEIACTEHVSTETGKASPNSMGVSVSVAGTVNWDSRVFVKNGVYNTNPLTYAKGTKIEIQILNDKRLCTGSYSVKAVTKKVKNFEKEKNDSVKKANTVKQKTAYKGIAEDGNYDYFVFTAPAKGQYKISFDKVLIDKLPGRKFINDSMTMQLVSSKNTALKTYLSSVPTKLTTNPLKVVSNPVSMKTQTLKKGQKVYIRITLSSVSSFRPKVRSMYTFKITKA